MDNSRGSLAGKAPLDAGLAPVPAATALSPGESRTVSLLSGAGGCMLGGGDPSQSLELEQPSPDAIRALVLALTLAATPGLINEALAG